MLFTHKAAFVEKAFLIPQCISYGQNKTLLFLILQQQNRGYFERYPLQSSLNFSTAQSKSEEEILSLFLTLVKSRKLYLLSYVFCYFVGGGQKQAKGKKEDK